MKTLAKSTLCAAYKYSGAMRAQEAMARWTGRSFSAVLLFHRVTDLIPPDGLTVETSMFRSLCKMLARDFHVVPLSEVVRMTRSGESPPRRTVAITFDDCYQDNLGAARILNEHGLPASFFIPTAYVGTDHVFEWDQGLTPMPNLTWDEVREMSKLGHEIGSHTVHHVDMAKAAPDLARTELLESKRTLEDRLGKAVRHFAYPFGGRQNFRPDYLKLVSETGYDACFSGYGGFITHDLWGQVLPREPVPYFRSLLNFELHLAGCLDWWYAIKRRVGLIV